MAKAALAGRRAFIGQIGVETNTFSPLPTGWGAFREGGLAYGDASRTDPHGVGLLMRTFRNLAEADGLEVVESVCAFAQPGGPVVRQVYEVLRDRLLADLTAAGPLDVVLLSLHGAMVADGYEDCEGDLLGRIRRIVGGSALVGVLLDPHSHLTEAMLRNADALVAYKHYPHVDLVPRAQELYRVCAAACAGRVRPVMAAFDCRMIGFYPTGLEPMAGVVRALEAAEAQPGILSASFIHGFPFGDTPATGSRMLVVADADRSLAAATAEALGRQVYGLREALRGSFLAPEAAIAEARSLQGLVVLAERSDNPGGGAPGDNTELLAALLAAGAEGCAYGILFDPGAVQLAQEAGPGARLPLRLGGKLGAASGDPLDLDCEVLGLTDDHRQRVFGAWRTFGRSAWVRAGGIDIVLGSQRTQVFSPEAFTELGVTLAGRRIVALKSAEHFRAEFAKVADHILRVVTPRGALNGDLAALTYRRKADLSYFPRVADPLGNRRHDP